MNYAEYTDATKNEMIEIIGELGLKIKKSMRVDAFEQFKRFAAFDIFIVSYENFVLATEVGYEMGIDHVETAVNYCYLIAFPSTEKQPSLIKSLFTKKEEINIDYRNIVLKLHDYVIKKNSLGEFCEKWAKKVNTENSNESVKENIDSFNLLSLNIERIIKQVSKDPLEHQVECLEVAINTHLGLYEQEKNEVSTNLFSTLKLIFKGCKNLDEAILKMDSLKFIENNIDPSITTRDQRSFNTLLKLGIARGYLTYGELNDFGIQHINIKLIESFNALSIDYIEKPDPPSIVF